MFGLVLLGAALVVGLGLLSGALLANRLRRKRPLWQALAAGGGVGCGAALLAAAGVALTWLVKPEAPWSSPSGPPVQEIHSVAAAPAPPLSEQPTDAQLLEHLTGSTSGRWKRDSDTPVEQAAVLARLDVVDGGSPAVVVLFSLTQPEAETDGTLPVRGLSGFALIELLKTGGRWEYAPGAPGLVGTYKGVKSAAISTPVAFDAAPGLPAVRWAVKYHDSHSGASDEETYIVLPSKGKRTLVFSRTTGLWSKGAHDGSPTDCRKDIDEIAVTYPAEAQGRSRLEITSRQSDCETGVSSTWRSLYDFNPQLGYPVETDIEQVDGSAPPGGWICAGPSRS